MAQAILLHEFDLGEHSYRAFYQPKRNEWLVVNSIGSFAFKGPEELGKGRVRAHTRKLVRHAYEYLLDNASVVIAKINGEVGYLDTFRFSERKAWARAQAAALA